MFKNVWVKNLLAVLTAVVLLIIGFCHFLSKEQFNLLINAPFYYHLVSCLLALPVYFLSGIELYIVYSSYSNTKIKTYDVFTLPLVMNLWGFILPVQGSFLYTMAYFKFKYKMPLVNSFNIYMFIFSITMMFSGMIGLIYLVQNGKFFSIYFFLLSSALFLNPLFFLAAKKLLSYVSSTSRFYAIKIRLDEIFAGVSLLFSQKSTVALLLLTNILNLLLNTIWAYWVVHSLGLHISLGALFILSGLMKLTLIVKIAPGNLGVTQLFAGGMIGLIGGKAAEGFLLSTFQSITVISLAFTLGTVFTIINMKYFSWQAIKSILKQKEISE